MSLERSARVAARQALGRTAAEPDTFTDALVQRLELREALRQVLRVPCTELEAYTLPPASSSGGAT